MEEDRRKLMPQIKLAEKIGQVNHIKSDPLTLLGQQSAMNMIGQMQDQAPNKAQNGTDEIDQLKSMINDLKLEVNKLSTQQPNRSEDNRRSNRYPNNNRFNNQRFNNRPQNKHL